MPFLGLLFPLSIIVLLHSHYLTVLALCPGRRNYDITFQYQWTLNIDPDQPIDDPANPAGFSRLHCAVHNAGYVMWQSKAFASQTLITLVDQDKPSFEPLLQDIDPTTNKDVYNSSISDKLSYGVTESAQVVVQVDGDRNFTHISCIALINPSPGWFVGLSSKDVCENNNFLGTLMMGLNGWTSGIYEDFEYVADDYTKHDPALRIQQVLGKVVKYGDVNVTDREYADERADDMSSCFPAGELVTLADGSEIPVERVARNQLVASSDRYTTSQVFMHSHADPHAVTRFVRITFTFRDGEDARSLRVSPAHYVYRVSADDGTPELVAASAVAVGDSLIGADRLPRRVDQVSSVVAKGLYNPHSLDGDLIVSGVRVSSFTSAVDPQIANSALVPFRFLHRIGLYAVQDVFSNHVLTGKWNKALSRLLPGGR